jgi:hypothetical protein
MGNKAFRAVKSIGRKGEALIARFRKQTAKRAYKHASEKPARKPAAKAGHG